MRGWNAHPRWVPAFDDFPLTSVEVKARVDALQNAYLDTVHGRSERWGQWLDVVEMSPSTA